MILVDDDRSPSRRLLRAFTLVEMLVVISLITLLISMLLPSLGKSKEQARMTQCMANTRSQATAFIAWADSSCGVFPTADQTTWWKLNALYVMDKKLGHDLNSYGLFTNPKDGSTPAAEVKTAWHCPMLGYKPRLYIANHSSGVLHIDQYMIQTGLEVQGKHAWSRLGKRTPRRSSDSIGVLTADHNQNISGSFVSNQKTAGQVQNYSQSYSDGHARLVPANEMERPSPGAAPYAKWDSGWPWSWPWVE